MKWVEAALALALVLLLASRWLAPVTQPVASHTTLGDSVEWNAGRSRPSLHFGGVTNLVATAPPPDTLRVVTDFQCPFCKSLHHVLDSLAELRPFVVELVHLPLTKIHPQALAAAVAFECAAEQSRHRQMHDALFDHPDLVRKGDFAKLAEVADVQELQGFEQCVKARSLVSRVEDDARVAREAGVRTTPTVVLRGRRVEGSLSRAGLITLLSPRDP